MATPTTAGPDGLWSDELEPSRGQNATLVGLFCDLIGTDRPTTRKDASILISRLHACLADPDGPARVRADIPF